MMRRWLENWRGDLMGGLMAALVSLPMSMSVGLLALAPLGPSFAGVGVVAGFAAAIVSGAVAALAGGSPLQISGTRASTAVVFAAMLGTVAAHATAVRWSGERVLTVALCALALAGVIQMLLGAFRLGRLIKFIPYPVLAGFMTGLALVILLGQLRPLLGLAPGYSWLDFQWHDVRLGGVLVTVVTVAVIVLAPRWFKRVPPLLLGLLVGIGLHHLLVGTPVALGGALGVLPEQGLSWLPWERVASLPWGAPGWWDLWGALLPSVLLLAMVASIESLLSAAALDATVGSRHASNRELVGQGLGNVAGACLGAVPSAGAVNRGLVAWRQGGRTRLAALVHSLALLLILWSGHWWVELIPMAALAGVMISIGWSMLSEWALALRWRWTKQGRIQRDAMANGLVMLLVAVATVASNLMVALAVGMVASMLLILRQMSQSIVRRAFTARHRRSRTVRSGPAQRALAEHGNRIVVLQLQGALFFGTADLLAREVEQARGQAQVLVLDCRLVHDFDATGARMLQQLIRQLAADRVAAVFAYLPVDDPRAQLLQDVGLLADVPAEHWFPDLDQALAWGEGRVLTQLDLTFGIDQRVLITHTALFQGLNAADADLLLSYMERVTVDAGAALFAEGDPGDGLYLLTAGLLTIRLRRGAQWQRLATYGPGVMIGEMALLEDKPRSADAWVEVDAELYQLGRDAFQRIQQEHPELAAALIANIALELAQRLRATSDELRSVEE